jgi:hypothetical protein
VKQLFVIEGFLQYAVAVAHALFGSLPFLSHPL